MSNPNGDLYHFKTLADFIIYLEARAREKRNMGDQCHARSHDRARLHSAAAELESVAVICKASNLTVRTV